MLYLEFSPDAVPTLVELYGVQGRHVLCPEERLNVLKMTVAEMREYEDYQFNRRFEENVVKAARFLGEEKGREEGERKAKMETAKRMLEKGMSVDDILELTGLTLDELKSK